MGLLASPDVPTVLESFECRRVKHLAPHTQTLTRKMEIYVFAYLGVLLAAFLDSALHAILLVLFSACVIGADAYFRGTGGRRLVMPICWILWRALTEFVPAAYEDYGASENLMFLLGIALMFGLDTRFPHSVGVIARSVLVGLLFLPAHHTPDRVRLILVASLYASLHILTVMRPVDPLTTIWILCASRTIAHLVIAFLVCLVFLVYTYKSALWPKSTRSLRDGLVEDVEKGKEFQLED